MRLQPKEEYVEICKIAKYLEHLFSDVGKIDNDMRVVFAFGEMLRNSAFPYTPRTFEQRSIFAAAFALPVEQLVVDFSFKHGEHLVR